MKNKLSDLNNHLFMQLERLNDEDLSLDDLEKETERASALVKLSDQITTISGQQLKAVELVAKHGDRHVASLPMMISDKSGT